MRKERIAAPLKLRTLTSANVADAAPLLEQGWFESECRRAYIVEACRRILVAESMIGVLITQTGPSGTDRVLGAGAGAFVSPVFAGMERNCPRPGLTERVLQSSLTSRPCTLHRRDIEQANAGEGLRFAILFHQWLHSASEALQWEIRRHLQSRFLEDLRGYNIVELISEGWVTQIPWAVAGGFRVRNTYDTWYQEHDDPQPRRCLTGLSRDEARAAEGSAIAMVFDHAPAQLRLTLSQRRLLAYALRHRTDAEIAEELRVSLSAVKKTWAAIFEKASDLLPSIHESADLADAPGPRPKRGAQKRHTLLTYLQDHPEELRP